MTSVKKRGPRKNRYTDKVRDVDIPDPTGRHPAKTRDPALAERLVRVMALGVTLKDAFGYLGLCYDTRSVRKLYGEDVKRGRANGTVIVAHALMQRCKEGDTRAITFYLSCVAPERFNPHRQEKLMDDLEGIDDDDEDDIMRLRKDFSLPSYVTKEEVLQAREEVRLKLLEKKQREIMGI
jgi:hypothetical protein